MPSAPYTVELTFVDEKGNSSSHTLKQGQYVLGRAEDCDIAFPTGAATVSRHHARLDVTPGRVAVHDLESRTGTMVNGRVIREYELEPGDVITIGGFTIRPNLKEGQPSSRAAVVVPGRDDGEEDAIELERELEALRDTTDAVLNEVGRVIVGQRNVLRAVWATILIREHCLMVGVPGLAKTLMVKTFSQALGLDFSRIQFTPDLMPSDIIGSNVIQETPEGRRHFEFLQGPIFTQLLLADEINRTPPKTQAALLEAMQERQVTVGNRSLHLPAPFCVIATQNPIEQEGTYPLPEAQQDRFTLCIQLDYPTHDEEVDILIRDGQAAPDLACTIEHSAILRFQRVVDRVAVGRDLADYAARIARATRPGSADAPDWLHELVDWGAGPRAGLALLRVARALAAMDGRPAISGEDIRQMAPAVLRHRLSCNYRARARDLDEDAVTQRVVEGVRQP